MTTVEPQRMSVEEFLDFAYRPENIDRFFELVRGEPIERAFPARRQGAVCANVGYVLYSYAARRRDGYPCSNRSGFIAERNPDTVLGPDLAYFAGAPPRASLPEVYDDELPRLAVYVLLPQDTFSRMMRRTRQLLRRGVPLVWIVDPEAQTTTVYRANKEHYVFEEAEELTGEDVLPDFRCKVADFFKLPGES